MFRAKEHEKTEGVARLYDLGNTEATERFKVQAKSELNELLAWCFAKIQELKANN